MGLGPLPGDRSAIGLPVIRLRRPQAGLAELPRSRSRGVSPGPPRTAALATAARVENPDPRPQLDRPSPGDPGKMGERTALDVQTDGSFVTNVGARAWRT